MNPLFSIYFSKTIYQCAGEINSIFDFEGIAVKGNKYKKKILVLRKIK